MLVEKLPVTLPLPGLLLRLVREDGAGVGGGQSALTRASRLPLLHLGHLCRWQGMRSVPSGLERWRRCTNAAWRKAGAPVKRHPSGPSWRHSVVVSSTSASY